MSEIKDMRDKLSKLSIEERIRAIWTEDRPCDVIIPAADIYVAAAEALGCDRIHVPNISLADSIVDGLGTER